MSAAALLSELRRRDIELRAEGTELRCSGPAGALTAELREQLRMHKSDLIALLASAQTFAEQARAIVPLQPRGAGAPIFAVAGHNGDVFCYRGLARSLGEAQPFFGLQPPGLDGQVAPLARVEELAAYFAAQIRAVRPAACILAGYCAGGAIAFELARQLAQDGVAVRFVALFGSPYPEYFRRRTQLWRRLAQERARFAHHRRMLAARSWGERWRYLAAELGELGRRRALARAAARDPVLAVRATVEHATLRAVRSYRPPRFGGELKLFLPGSAWLGSGVDALRWGDVAARAQAHYGPARSSGADMLREPHVAAFADLVRRACGGEAP